MRDFAELPGEFFPLSGEQLDGQVLAEPTPRIDDHRALAPKILLADFGGQHFLAGPANQVMMNEVELQPSRRSGMRLEAGKNLVHANAHPVRSEFPPSPSEHSVHAVERAGVMSWLYEKVDITPVVRRESLQAVKRSVPDARRVELLQHRLNGSN